MLKNRCNARKKVFGIWLKNAKSDNLNFFQNKPKKTEKLNFWLLAIATLFYSGLQGYRLEHK